MYLENKRDFLCSVDSNNHSTDAAPALWPNIIKFLNKDVRCKNEISVKITFTFLKIRPEVHRKMIESGPNPFFGLEVCLP